MRNQQPIVVNNIQYSSIAEAANKLHVPLSTALTRLRNGLSPEEAFLPEDEHDEQVQHEQLSSQNFGQHRTYRPNEVMTQKKAPVVAYKLDGHLFHDAASLAAAYHADPKLVQKRLDAGWSVAQSVGVAPQPRNAQQLHLCDNSTALVVDGTLYGSTQELAHTLHLDLKLLVAHLHAGTPVQEVVDTLRNGTGAIHARKSAPEDLSAQPSSPQLPLALEGGVVVQGQTFASEGAAARAFGVARSTFYKRRAKGMSLLDSLGLPAGLSPAVVKDTVRTEKKKATAGKTSKRTTTSVPLKDLQAQAAVVPATAVSTIGSPVVVGGITYTSERAAAKAHGIPPSTFYKRKNKGHSLLDILGQQAATPATQSSPATQVPAEKENESRSGLYVSGKHYPSERAAAKACGVAPSTFYKKRNRGETLASILGVPESDISLATAPLDSAPPPTVQETASISTAATVVIVSGKQYLSERAAAKAHGVPLSTFYKKRNRGESLLSILGIQDAQAATEVPTVEATSAAASVVVHGKSYPSDRAAAKAHGIPLSTFYKKRKEGMSLLDIIKPKSPATQPVDAPAAVTATSRVTPLSLLSKPIMCNGISYPSHRALAKAFSISPHSLRYRLDTLHLSPEAAVGVTTEAKNDGPCEELEEVSNLRAHPVVFRNVSYPSFRKLAQAFGVDPRKAHQRVARGWPLEKALDAPDEPVSTVAAEASAAPSTEKKMLPLPDSVYFQGVHYPSVAAFAKAHNKPADLVGQRLQDGWTRAEAVDLLTHSTDHDEKRMTDHFLVNGQSFKSVRSLAEHFHIKDHVIRYRLQSGWNIHQAVGLEPAPSPASEEHAQQEPLFPVTLNTVHYASSTALAQAYQLSPRLVRQRLKQGWSVRAAVGLPEEGAQSMGALVVDQQTFKSVRALASHFHISEAKVRYRMKVGWSAAQAVERAPSPDDLAKQSGSTRNISEMLPITLDEHVFHTAAAFARHYGLDTAKVSGRLRNGWAPQEAVELVTHQRKGATTASAPKAGAKAKFMIGKTGFSSVKELSAAYKLSVRMVQYRLNKGASPAQAVGLEPWSNSTNKNEQVILDGKSYPNYLSLCKALSLNYNMFMSRLGRGWSVRRAAVTPSAHVGGLDALLSTAQSLKQTPADIRLGKKHYRNIESFAKDHSLESTVVYDRLSKGWTPEQIVGQSPPPHWH